jgi:hypothetical protein
MGQVCLVDDKGGGNVKSRAESMAEYAWKSWDEGR